MRGYTPIIRVEVGGQNASDAFYKRLIKATVRDEEGQTSDTFTADFDDRDNAIELPSKQTKISVALGFRETGLVNRGLFEVQGYSIKGSEEGEFITLQAKGANLKGAEKAGGRESFENTTIGDIAKQVAQRSGLQAVVDPELAGVKVEYLARIGQSDLDLLTRLADANDGILKRAGGKVVITKRGSGKSAGGQDVPPIVIIKNVDLVKGWEITSDPRPQYGKVQAGYIDQATGKRMLEQIETGLEGPEFPLRHLLRNKEEAKRAAQSEASRLTRNTGSGHFELYGRPESSAGAEVFAYGFRSEVEGEWRCNAIEDVFQSGQGGGYTTKVHIKAPEKGKKAKGK